MPIRTQGPSGSNQHYQRIYKMISEPEAYINHSLTHAGWGGKFYPPSWFSADSRKTAARSAAVLGIPYTSSISHGRVKFLGQVMSGQGAIQDHVTPPQNPKSQVWRGAMGTIVNRSIWNFYNIMRSLGTTNLLSRNFHILDLGWGQFSGHPIISLWGKNQKAVFRQVWHETSWERFKCVFLTRFWQ